MLRATLVVVLLIVAPIATAQQSLEVISLRHRTAEQVLEPLRPLVEPGGTLTGQGSQLIVRVSPDNLAEIRRALEAIDRPQRRLQISVRFDDAAGASRRELGASAAISNRGARVEVRGEDLQATASARVDQRLQALEGARAMILGPTEGFAVTPRLAGNTVLMEIVSSLGASTVYGQLGEWFELGAVGSTRMWTKVETLDR